MAAPGDSAATVSGDQTPVGAASADEASQSTDSSHAVARAEPGTSAAPISLDQSAQARRERSRSTMRAAQASSGDGVPTDNVESSDSVVHNDQDNRTTTER